VKIGIIEKILIIVAIITLGIGGGVLLYEEINLKNTFTKANVVIKNTEGTILDAKFALLKEDIVISSSKSTIRDTDILKLTYNFHKEPTIAKPTYKQLKSHTVFITGIVPDRKYEDYMIERGRSWVGTGFVFKVSDKYTWIITNKHVAGIFANKKGNTTELYIGDSKKERVSARIVRFHPKYDIALLMVHGKLEGKRQVKGLSTAKPQDKVYVVGHHLGRPYIYGEGVFAGYQKSGTLTYDVIQVPVLFGNSGSAVFDQNGYVVSLIFAVNGVNMFWVDGAHGLAVPGEILQDFLVNWSF